MTDRSLRGESISHSESSFHMCKLVTSFDCDVYLIVIWCLRMCTPLLRCSTHERLLARLGVILSAISWLQRVDVPMAVFYCDYCEVPKRGYHVLSTFKQEMNKTNVLFKRVVSLAGLPLLFLIDFFFQLFIYMSSSHFLLLYLPCTIWKTV